MIGMEVQVVRERTRSNTELLFMAFLAILEDGGMGVLLEIMILVT